MDLEQREHYHRTEGRWDVLRTISVDRGMTLGATDRMILAVLRGAWPETDVIWIREQLTWLEQRGLVKVHRSHLEPWRALMTADGDSYYRYQTLDEIEGITRPAKYWGDAAR